MRRGKEPRTFEADDAGSDGKAGVVGKIDAVEAGLRRQRNDAGLLLRDQHGQLGVGQQRGVGGRRPAGGRFGAGRGRRLRRGRTGARRRPRPFAHLVAPALGRTGHDGARRVQERHRRQRALQSEYAACCDRRDSPSGQQTRHQWPTNSPDAGAKLCCPRCSVCVRLKR